MAKTKKSSHHGVEGPWTTHEIEFVTAYFANDMNKAAAATQVCGSKDEQARVAGEEFCKVPHVRKAISRLFTKGLADLNVAVHQQLMERWRVQAFVDRSSIYDDQTFRVKPLKQWTPEQKMLLESVTYQTTSEGDVVATPKLVSQDRAMLCLAKAAGVLLGTLGEGFGDFEGEVKAVREKVAKAALKAANAIAKARAKVAKPEAKKPKDDKR
jgi:hypothetical protein